MAVSRWLSGLFLLLGVITLVADLTRYATGGGLQMTSLLAFWKGIAPQSLTAFAGIVQRYAHPYIWDPGFVRLLVLPTAFLCFALGALFGILGRRKRRVNIYAN
ncbi:MAG: hypothetical protein ABL898_04440 [Hyphomicrobiaceae bacterium]|nr:hypothetical protein [Hyphomicrobiaceae bacterium]